MLAGLSRYQGAWQTPQVTPFWQRAQQNMMAPFQGFDNFNVQQLQQTPMPAPGNDWQIPEDIDALYKKYADMYGVPLNEVRAIGYQESRHGRNMRSRAGAIGVMQLMPGTAAGLGVDPNNLEQNIAGGVRYYAQQRKAFGGNIAHAMAAYNAGPGRIRNWLRGQGKPLKDETINYMRQVPRWTQMYQGY